MAEGGMAGLENLVIYPCSSLLHGPIEPFCGSRGPSAIQMLLWCSSTHNPKDNSDLFSFPPNKQRHWSGLYLPSSAGTCSGGRKQLPLPSCQCICSSMHFWWLHSSNCTGRAQNAHWESISCQRDHKIQEKVWDHLPGLQPDDGWQQMTAFLQESWCNSTSKNGKEESFDGAKFWWWNSAEKATVNEKKWFPSCHMVLLMTRGKETNITSQFLNGWQPFVSKWRMIKLNLSTNKNH